jgi:hypothetical protein
VTEPDFFECVHCAGTGLTSDPSACDDPEHCDQLAYCRYCEGSGVDNNQEPARA